MGTTAETAAYTVGEVAHLAGVTVRTLHHYDDIGLLEPSGRTASGYRSYDSADVARLQEILFYRELDFSLDEIRRALADPNHDRLAVLARQRELLFARLGRVEALISAVERAIAAQTTGVTMTTEEMLGVFGEFDPAEHAEEVEARWSGPLLDESRRRTTTYSKQQWQEIQDDGEGIRARFAAAKLAGESAEGTVAVGLAEEHRRHIDRWFYPCSTEVHTGLGAMYVADERFTQYWDVVAPGLAEYVNEAIQANARRDLS